MAAAAVHLMNVSAAAYAAETRPMCSHINVGTGVDVTIRELAESLAQVVGYPGRLVFDSTKPDGTPRKLLDVARAERLGWRARIGLAEGLASTYREAFLDGASLRLG
jgi:GDP-L-fucose synthase